MVRKVKAHKAQPTRTVNEYGLARTALMMPEVRKICFRNNKEHNMKYTCSHEGCTGVVVHCVIMDETQEYMKYCAEHVPRLVEALDVIEGRDE